MELLEELLNWLNLKPTNSLKIINLATDKELVSKANASYFEKFGGLENYLQDLISKGINEIQVAKRYKSGSSDMYKGSSRNMKLNTKCVVGRGEQSQTAAPSQQPSIPTPAMNAAPGLSGEQAYKVYNHDNLFAENNRQKAEIKQLENENKRLERELMEFKIGEKSKPGALESLISNLKLDAESLGVLATIIENIKGGKAPALSAPENLGRFRASLYNYVTSDQCNEEIAKTLLLILGKSKEENFRNQLNTLLQNGTNTN